MLVHYTVMYFYVLLMLNNEFSLEKVLNSENNINQK